MLVLHGNPLSTGSIYRSACMGKFPRTYMTHEGKALKEAYQLQAQSQWKQETLTGSLAVTIRLYFKDKRARDWDNYHKLSMDALTGIVWVDDSQVEEAHVYKHIDVDNPRIEVEVSVLS